MAVSFFFCSVWLSLHAGSVSLAVSHVSAAAVAQNSSTCVAVSVDLLSPVSRKNNSELANQTCWCFSTLKHSVGFHRLLLL
jgi:hypothetical protein